MHNGLLSSNRTPFLSGRAIILSKKSRWMLKLQASSCLFSEQDQGRKYCFFWRKALLGMKRGIWVVPFPYVNRSFQITARGWRFALASSRCSLYKWKLQILVHGLIKLHWPLDFAVLSSIFEWRKNACWKYVMNAVVSSKCVHYIPRLHHFIQGHSNWEPSIRNFLLILNIISCIFKSNLSVKSGIYKEN